MELQKFCRGKDIKLNIQIQEEIKQAVILKTTLQPIVENAFLPIHKGKCNDSI